MYVVYIDDAIYCERKSPVEAQLIAEAKRQQGYETTVVFDEGACCHV